MTHTLPVDELWIAYGTGKRLRYIAVHSIALLIEREKAQALPLFHAITGCDIVSKKLHGKSGTCPGGYFVSFAGYVPLASQNPYPIYSTANYRPHLSHFWANVIVISSTEFNASRLLNIKAKAGTIFLKCESS